MFLLLCIDLRALYDVETGLDLAQQASPIYSHASKDLGGSLSQRPNMVDGTYAVFRCKKGEIPLFWSCAFACISFWPHNVMIGKYWVRCEVIWSSLCPSAYGSGRLLVF